MREGFARDDGASFDGPRAFIVGFVGFCVGCIAIDYGTNRITARFESTAAASVAGSTPAAAGGALALPAPARVPSPCPKPHNPHSANAAAKPIPAPAAGQQLHASAAAAPSFTPSPAVSRSASAPLPALKPAVPLVIAPAPLAGRALRRHRATPVAAPTATPATPTARASGELLVPFKDSAALTPSSGLDSRAATKAPLLISPGGAAAPPDTGSPRNL